MTEAHLWPRSFYLVNGRPIGKKMIGLDIYITLQGLQGRFFLRIRKKYCKIFAKGTFVLHIDGADAVD
jgi:hypothetical protein